MTSSLVIYLNMVFMNRGNCYYIIDSKTGNSKQISNFILEPVFLLSDADQPRRLVKVINEKNKSFYKDISTDAFVELTMLKKVLEGFGNFLFFGKPEDFQQIKRKLYSDIPTAYPISILGYHKAGFYSFGNGVYIPKEGFKRVDVNGIIQHKDDHFYLPAFSNIRTSVKFGETQSYDYEERFAYEPTAITIKAMVHTIRSGAWPQWQNWLYLFIWLHCSEI